MVAKAVLIPVLVLVLVLPLVLVLGIVMDMERLWRVTSLMALTVCLASVPRHMWRRMQHRWGRRLVQALALILAKMVKLRSSC